MDTATATASPAPWRPRLAQTSRGRALRHNPGMDDGERRAGLTI